MMRTILVPLAIAAMMPFGTALQNGVLSEMNKTTPPGMPNVFLLDVAAKDDGAVPAARTSPTGPRATRRSAG